MPGPGGGALPDVTLPCLGGGTDVDLSSLRDRWCSASGPSGCAPCKEEMPALQAFHEEYGDRVPVLGVDFQDQYPGSALETGRRARRDLPALADPGATCASIDGVREAAAGCRRWSFVDADGKIAHAVFEGLDSEQQVVDLVREHLGVSL